MMIRYLSSVLISPPQMMRTEVCKVLFPFMKSLWGIVNEPPTLSRTNKNDL